MLGLAHSCFSSFYFLLLLHWHAPPPAPASMVRFCVSSILLFLHPSPVLPPRSCIATEGTPPEGTYLRLLLPPPCSCSIALARSCFSSDSTPPPADGWQCYTQLRFNHLGSSNKSNPVRPLSTCSTLNTVTLSSSPFLIQGDARVGNVQKTQ